MSLSNHCNEDSTRVKINIQSAPPTLNVGRHLQVYPKWLHSGPRRPIKHSSERNVILPFLASLFSVSVVLVFGAPLMIISTALFLPIAIFVRFTLNNIKFCCSSKCRHSVNSSSANGLAPSDAIWLHPNPFGANSAYSLLFFDKGLTVEKVKEMIIKRLMTSDRSGRCVYPRFRQKIVPLTVGYLWADEEDFDVDNHVFCAPNSVSDRCTLESYLNELINRPFKLSDRSPWEIHVVTGYEAGEDTVLVVKIHHCLSDAVSLVKILTKKLSDNNNCNLKPRCGGTTFPLNICRALIIGPLTFLSWLICTRRDYNLLNHSQQLSGPRLVTWSQNISLSKIMRIKQVSRSTVNDVILAALSGSLRKVFQNNGVIRPKKIKANISFDLRFESRSSTISMGSKFALVHVTLPLHLEGTIPRLWSVRSSMDQMKSSADAVSMWGAMALLETFLPQCLSRRLLGRVWSKSSLTVNNIPGPETDIYTMGIKLKSIASLIPPRDGVSLAVTFTSYAKILRMGVMADSGTIADPNAIITGFINQIEIMSKLLASRRIPGEHRRKSSIVYDLHDLDQGPSAEEIQTQLHKVQKELHELTLKLSEVSSAYPTDGGQLSATSAQEALLISRITNLKQEFSNLLVQLRRRKSVVQGILLIDEDEDMDGELRRPRRRAVSVPSRKSSLTITTSTARPLTTPGTSSQLSPTEIPSTIIDNYS